jgi:hypothetical protein
VFERYQQSKTRRWSPVTIGIFAAAVVLVAIVIRACVVHSAEQRDIETVNEAFAMSRPPKLAVPNVPSLVKLPGMSIDLPERLDLTGGYERGTATGVFWSISWMPGEQMASQAESEKLVAFVAQRTGHTAGNKRAMELGGNPGYAVDMLGRDPQTMIMTACGGRSVQITTSDDAAAIESARASFRCTPAPGRLASRSVAVEPRAGWHVKPMESALALTKDDVVVVLTAEANEPPRAYFKAFTEASREKHGTYTIQRGSFSKEDNTEHPGAAISWPCPERQTTGYAFVMQWGPSGLDAGIALALTARCYGADETLPTYH